MNKYCKELTLEDISLNTQPATVEDDFLEQNWLFYLTYVQYENIFYK